MMLYDTIIKRQQEMSLSNGELAKRAGVSLPTITKIHKGEDITMANLREICGPLNLILTTVDRSVIAKQEIEVLDAKIYELMEKLDALEKEKDALEAFIK